MDPYRSLVSRAWPRGCAARQVLALVVLSFTCASAGATSFGTDIAALTTSHLYDGNGSPTTSHNCDFVVLSDACGPDHRASATYNASSVGDAALGSLSGRVAVDVFSIYYVGQADLDAHWFDTFTAVGNGLPPGTRAQLALEIDIDGHVQPSHAAPFPYTRTQASFTLGGKDGQGLLGVVRTADGAETVATDNALLVDLDVPFVLYGNLFATTAAEKPIHDGSVDDGEADMRARYFVRVLTPGVSLVSASGTDYSGTTDVPAPAGAGWLVAALLPFGAARRRRA